MSQCLLADDAEYKLALRDAFRPSFRPLAELFAIFQALCELFDSSSIFNKLREMFFTDLRSQFRAHLHLSHFVLLYIATESRELLSAMYNFALSQCGLPGP